MPHKCCVATCRGNYNNGLKVAVFSFPKEESQLKKWIWNCKRQDSFVPTKHSRVCELHFTDGDIIRNTEVFDEKSGNHIIVPLAYPRLKPHVVPSHLNSSEMIRESSDKKKRKRENK